MVQDRSSTAQPGRPDQGGTVIPVAGGRRNGLPPTRPYVWRAPRPAWMGRAITAAEATHGPPVPTCVCGQPIILGTRRTATCPDCGYRTTSSVAPGTGAAGP